MTAPNSDSVPAEELTGRVATAAHPLCRCGKPYRPSCRICGAKVNQECRPVTYEGEVLSTSCDGRPPQRIGSARDCRLHRPLFEGSWARIG